MLTTISLFVLGAHAGAPNLDKAVHIHLERTVDAPVADAWDFLAEDFASIGTWADGLDSRSMRSDEVPTTLRADADAPVPGRVVQQAGREDQLQVLVDFDREAHSFTFQAGHPPGPLAYAHNQHTLVALDDGRTRVDIDVVLVPKGLGKLLKGVIASKFTSYMEAYLDAAQRGIEGADDAVVDGAP